MPADELLVRATLRNEISGPARVARADIRGLGDEVARTNARGAEGAAAGAALAGGMAQAEHGASRLHQRLLGLADDLASGLVRGVKLAAIGLAGLTAAAGIFGVRAANQFEQTQIALNGFLGSAEAGGEMFRNLQQLNLKTPFELGDLSTGARQLLGFGFAANSIIPTLKAATDVAAGLGGGADTLTRILINLGQIQSQGKVTGRELRDLAMLGVPGYQMVADILGVSQDQVKNLGDNATVSADQFLAAFNKMGGPLARFAGQAEAQMGTLAGMWSNVKDSFNVGIAAAARPLVDQLKPLLDPKTGVLTTFITETLTVLGPPLANLGGGLLRGLTGVLPAASPILAALANGAVKVLDAMGPGFAALQPVAGELAASIGDLAAALVPVMPDLVRGFVGIVGVLPRFVDLLADLIPLVDPLLRLLAGFLNLAPVQDGLATLLGVLLGYRALDAVVRLVRDLSGAFRGLAAAEEAEAGARATSGTPGAARLPPGVLGALGLGATGALLEVQGVRSKKAGGGEAAEMIGGGALIGAGIGSVIPGVGTLIGGGVGAAAGTIGFFIKKANTDNGGGGVVVPASVGDTPTPRGLAGTVAAHLTLDGMVPGQRRVTNATYSRHASSDHKTGRALDLVGSGLFAYAQAVRSAGGYADFHGDHLHAVYGDTPAPRTLGGAGDRRGGQLVVNGPLVHVGQVSADVDLEHAVETGIRRFYRDRDERGAHA